MDYRIYILVHFFNRNDNLEREKKLAITRHKVYKELNSIIEKKKIKADVITPALDILTEGIQDIYDDLNKRAL